MNIEIIFTLITFGFVSTLLYPVCVSQDISKKQKRIFCVIVTISFLIGGAVLYSNFGTPEILPLLAQRDKKLVLLKEKITTNSQEIKKDPKNIKAWLTLGDSFMETSQFSAAVNSYKQAVLRSEGNPAIIMAYARALIFAADGNVTAEAKKSLDMLIMLQPKNEEARYFEALYKLQNGNKEAMQDMKDLYKSLPADSPVKDMIDRQIGRK